MQEHPYLSDVVHEITPFVSSRMHGKISVEWTDGCLFVIFEPHLPDGSFGESTQWKFTKDDH